MKKTLTLLVTSVCLAMGILSAQTTMTNSDLVKLSKAGLSEDFITNLIDQQGSRLSSDPSALIALKNEGVNERIISAVVRKAPSREPLNSDTVLRLVQAGFSDGFVINLLNAQPAKFTVDASRIVELKQAGVSERILALMVQQGGVRELPSGSEISVRLIDSVDSDRNSQGDEFRASLEDPITIGNDVVVPKGADAKLRLVSEQESGKLTGKAGLTVQLVSITVDGKTVPVELVGCFRIQRIARRAHGQIGRGGRRDRSDYRSDRGRRKGRGHRSGRGRRGGSRSADGDEGAAGADPVGDGADVHHAEAAAVAVTENSAG